MTEDQGSQEEEKKEHRFGFTPEGEEVGYVDLDGATFNAMKAANDIPGEYGGDYQNIPMAFELSESRETEGHYVITLSFRPQGTFPGVPGSGQFYVTKEGIVDLRQVLDLPRLAEGRRIPIIPITIGIGVVIVGVIVAVIAGPTIGIPPVVPVVHTLTTSASPAQGGSVSPGGSNTYNEGSPVTVIAPSIQGHLKLHLA